MRGAFGLPTKEESSGAEKNSPPRGEHDGESVGLGCAGVGDPGRRPVAYFSRVSWM